MGFIENFKSRGYFYQCSDIDSLTKLMHEGKIAAYVGFDCTAKSLHVGNLMQVMALRLLQQHGHKPIILIGTATSKVGDPHGKDEMRKILSDEELAANIAGIKKSLSKFITFGSGPSDAIMVSNGDWLEGIGYIEFLRDFGRHISVNRMLTMESAKARLDRDQSLSFLEFNYMLLQGYDFYHLAKHHDCILQIGGSDQWGNILMGVDLARKMTGKEVFALTTQLLTTSSGAKMGKSVSGAVWLNEDMLSPYDYFQFWRNIEDPDLIRFAKLYSEWPDDKLAELERMQINDAKKELAHRLTAMCHGIESADKAMETARKVFEEGAVGDDLPVLDISKEEIDAGIAIIELFVRARLSESKSEARKLIRGQGARLNDEKALDENLLITQAHFTNYGYIKLSAGKKKHVLVQVAD
jgi:tyrosyl-tRNA synthetase